MRTLLALAAGLVSTSCVASVPTPTTTAVPERLSVVTTIYPLQYLAERIGEDRVEVLNVTPPGVEAHDFEPSPRDVAAIYRADLFVYNGSGFEVWASRVVAGLPQAGPTVVEATESMELRAGGDEGGLDPHVWQDPRRYRQQAEVIWRALVAADPSGAATYGANWETLKTDLESLEAEMAQGLASCARDTMVVSHEAFGYLAERFGLRQLPISGLSPEAEPSPARLRLLVGEVRASGATHIFFESAVSPAVAETLAREVGAQSLVLSTLESLTPEESQAGEDYFSIMRENLANLRMALGCR
ncbi:MAG: zinc ABC transporter substrate-binding protein [Chloroflexi bacterium]|nr:zinc ABC transporter substrate-binding protein [Chloroflexota bacterium]